MIINLCDDYRLVNGVFVFVIVIKEQQIVI